MPAEHLDENGKLRQGYFCSKCGQATNMYGHRGLCEYKPELVKRIREINEAGSIEAYTFNKLKKKA